MAASRTSWLAMGYNSVSMASNINQYFQVGMGARQNNTTEANVTSKCQIAGSYSKLTFRLATNARSNVTTVRTRKNLTAGAISISIPATTSGEFQNTTNTESVAVNDSYNLHALTGGGSANLLTVTTASLVFTSTSDTLTIQKLAEDAAPSDGFSTLRYPVFATNYTLKKLGVSLASNSRTAAITFQLYESWQGNKIPVVIFNAAESGEKVDLTGECTVTTPTYGPPSNCDFSVRTTFAAGTGSAVGRITYIYLESSSDNFLLSVMYSISPNSYSMPNTFYQCIGGMTVYTLPETSVQGRCQIPFTVSRLDCKTSAADVTVAGITSTLRKNATDTTVVYTKAAGAAYTGNQEQVTGLSEFVDVNNLLTWKIASTGTGWYYIVNLTAMCTTYYPPPPVVNIKTVSYINRTVQGIS